MRPNAPSLLPRPVKATTTHGALSCRERSECWEVALGALVAAASVVVGLMLGLGLKGIREGGLVLSYKGGVEASSYSFVCC
jgi:hypothetical protein